MHLSGVIGYLSKSLLVTTKDDASMPSTPLSVYIDSLGQDCEHYKTWVYQLKSKSLEIHKVTVSRFNVEQASSVSQLTLIAAFSLPLSLAAGILSMQTRFAQLDLLLYDFVGVVFLLATIAFIVGLVNRYGLDFFKLMIRGQRSRRAGFDGAKSRVMRVVVMSL